MTRGKYGYSKADAIAAERDGVPSLLPDGNPWKYEVERHRWGYHRAPQTDPRCPICQLNDGRQT
jgi:hypothetical protein